MKIMDNHEIYTVRLNNRARVTIYVYVKTMQFKEITSCLLIYFESTASTETDDSVELSTDTASLPDTKYLWHLCLLFLFACLRKNSGGNK